jgi:hypothetical protein
MLKSGGSVFCGLVVRTANLSTVGSSKEAMNRVASQCASNAVGDVKRLQRACQLSVIILTDGRLTCCR